MVFLYYVNNSRQSFYISHHDMRLDTLSNVVISFMLAFLLTVLVEQSFINIERNYLLKSNKVKLTNSFIERM